MAQRTGAAIVWRPVQLRNEFQATGDGPEVKQALKRYTEDAVTRGVFGALCFIVGEEVFWVTTAASSWKNRWRRPNPRPAPPAP